MRIAKQVQARLFPQNLPVTQDARLRRRLHPEAFGAVGGDYYDYLNLGSERIGLVIGDIAGEKGIAAALLMANLQANLRSQCAIASEHHATLPWNP